MRLLRNRKTGIIRPWNEFLARHPDMFDYTEGDTPAAPTRPKAEPKGREPSRAAKNRADAAAKAAEEKAVKKPAKKQAVPTPDTGADLDDLMAGLGNG